MKLSMFIAGVFGTVGFVVSVAAGLVADNAFNSILIKALLSCGACYVVGYLVGSVAQVVTREHADHIARKVAEQDRKEEEEKEAARQAAEAEAAQAAGGAAPAA